MAGSEYRAGPSGRFSHGAPARGFKKLTLEREEIAEMDYRPSKAEGTYRLLVLRKTILVEKGQKRLLPQRRYHFYVTNIPAVQAWNLKAWMGMVLPARLQGRQLMKMEYRRFLREIIEMPCQILHTGRRRVYRLLDVNAWSRLLLEGSVWLKRRAAT